MGFGGIGHRAGEGVRLLDRAWSRGSPTVVEGRRYAPAELRYLVRIDTVAVESIIVLSKRAE